MHPKPACLLVQEDRGDDPRRNGNEKKIAVGFYPVITTGRRAEAARAPIIDYVLTIPILARQAIAAVEVTAPLTLAPVCFAVTLAAVLPLVLSIEVITVAVLNTCGLYGALRRLFCNSAPLIPLRLSPPLSVAIGLIGTNILFLLGKGQATETH